MEDNDKLDIQTMKLWRKIFVKIHDLAEEKIAEKHGVKYLSDISDDYDRHSAENQVEYIADEMADKLLENLVMLCSISPVVKS